METPLDNVKFEFGATYEKAWQDEKTGRMIVRAVASDDRLDLQRDRMGAAALQKMVDAAKKGVPFLETHRSVFEFGRTVDGAVKEFEDGGKKIRQFIVDVELDGDFPQARKLFKEIANGDCKRQLSIGGKLNLKNKEAVAVEMTSSGLARTINDLDLDHIASTREKQAANPRTSFTEAVSKAIEDAELLAKDESAPHNAPVLELSEDAKKGLQILEEIGKGGISMKVPASDSKPENKDEGKPVPEVDDKKKPVPPASTEAKPEDVKYGCGKNKLASLSEEITAILSKGKKPFPNAAPPFKKKGEGKAEGEEVDSEEEGEMEEEEKAIFDSLWATRFALAKGTSEAGFGEGEKARLAEIVAAGPFAPRSGASGIAPGAYIPDKAKGEDAIGSKGVTDSKRNIQAGGEIKPTTMTAKEAFDFTMRNLKLTDKLPQASETVDFGKALDGMKDGLEKTLVAKFDSAMGAVLEKSTEITKEMMTVAAESIMGEQDKATAEITKSIENLAGHVNEESKRLATIEARILRVEKSGGISQGGPVATEDLATRPSTPRNKGMWGGLFDGAASQALGRYKA
jgi:hypothetical protein